MSESWLPGQREVASEPALRRLRIGIQKTAGTKSAGTKSAGPVRRIRRKSCSETPPQPRRSSEEA